MSVIFRLTERGDAGAGGPIASGPSAIDGENNRLRLKSMRLCGSIQIIAKFPSAQDDICVMVICRFAPALVRYCGMDPQGQPGVRIKRV
jgi:hypothetical protein